MLIISDTGDIQLTMWKYGFSRLTCKSTLQMEIAILRSTYTYILYKF